MKGKSEIIRHKGKKAAKGSVCIFLSLVMLPVMTFGGMLTDAAKVQSAKLCIEGAADLAMNAALSFYDRVLFDVYGLFALSDDMSSLERNVSEYYRETIEGYGFFDAGDSFTREFINGFFGVFGEDAETGGILRMDAENFSLKPLQSSSLANPNVLENQIVEYMKYRGPVEIGEGLISKISCLSEVSAQTKVLEKKLKCEKKYSAAGSSAEKVYGYVSRFNSSAGEIPRSGTDPEEDEFLKAMNMAEEFYQIMCLYTALGVYSSETGKICADGSKIGIEYPDAGMSPGEKADYLSEIIEELQERAEIKTVLEIVEGETAEPPLPSGENIEEARKYLSDEYGRLYRLYNAHESVRFAAACSDELLSVLKKENLTEYGETAAAAELLSELPDRIMKYAEAVSRASEEIAPEWGMSASQGLHGKWYVYTAECLDSLEWAYKAALELISEVEKAEAERNEWKKSIDALSESTVKVSMYADYDSTASSFGKEETEAFLSLLSGRITSLKNFAAGLEALSFLGADISAGDFSETAFIKSYGKISKKIRDDRGLLSELYTVLSDGGTSSVKDFGFPEESDSLPAAAGGFRPVTADESPFFGTLEKNCGKDNDGGGFSADEAKNFKSDLTNKAKKKSTVPAEEKEEGPKSVSGMISDGILGRIEELADYADVKAPSVSVSLPSGDDDAEDSESAAESLQSVASFLGGIKSVLNAARDDLFVEEYITGMFSCRTDAVTVKEHGVTALSGEDISGNSFFGSEIEYVLFGSDKPELNVAKAEALIFGIRFALNTLYAMTASDIRATSLAAATSISGWTGFGVPVVQNVIIVSWALAESAFDMQKLMNGESVALYKSKNTWFLGLGGAKQFALEIAGEAASKAADTVFDSIDEALSDGSSEAIDALHSEIDDYMDDCIENVYEQVKDTIAGTVESLASSIAAASGETGIDEICSSLRDSLEAIMGKSGGLIGECLDFAAERFISDDLLNVSEQLLAFGADSSSEAKNADTINEILYGKDGNGGIIGGVREKVAGYVSGKIKSYADKFEKDISAAIDDGTAAAKKKVKDKLNGFIDGISGDDGKSAGGGRNTVTASFFSLSYREYLKMFMLMNYSFAKNSMLTRTARLIQINVSDRENGSFDITNSPTCISCVAGGIVPTLFIGEYLRNPDKESFGIYEGYGKIKLLEYSGISGY